MNTCKVKKAEGIAGTRIGTLVVDDSPLTGALTLHTPVLPRLPERIRRLVNAAYAEHGGAHQMTLGTWREVAEELKRKLVNKCHEHQQ
jgi:hypothetical protein